MTQEDKDLLLKYLSMALPYGVAVYCGEDWAMTLRQIDYECFCVSWVNEDIRSHSRWKRPYLRPMSSMTEEEFTELHNICPHSTFNKTNVRTWVVGLNGSEYGRITRVDEMCIFINWLLKKHFDFMGLIPKHLAIEVTESNNPYKN